MTHRGWLIVGLVSLIAVAQASQTLDKGAVTHCLEKCAAVRDWSASRSKESAHAPSSVAHWLFSVIFPTDSPAWNSFLATAYISGPPNLLLALVPANIDPSSLSALVAFGVGGLLGDVFFHLLPETFLGESTDTSGAVHFVLAETKRNSLLGMAIFIGFASFLVLDKSMRILRANGTHERSHHAGANEQGETSAITTTAEHESSDRELRTRRKKDDRKKPSAASGTPQIKNSAYLNLVADFTHNITDGLAIASSFWVSKEIGAITTVAVFFHEIPHEVGDFALLVQSGFTKSQAMMAQFVTALGALLGTIIGIGLQQVSAASSNKVSSSGIFGTSLDPGELVLPFTAGSFLYIAVSVLPELLEVLPNTPRQVQKSLTQLAAMMLGATLMFAISWAD